MGMEFRMGNGWDDTQRNEETGLGLEKDAMFERFGLLRSLEI